MTTQHTAFAALKSEVAKLDRKLNGSGGGEGMTTQEALETLEQAAIGYYTGQVGKKSQAALAVLKSAVEERDKIKERQKNTEGWWRNAKAYGMRMERSRNALKGPLAQMKARAEKAEAEVESLDVHLRIARDDTRIWNTRAEKAEAIACHFYPCSHIKLDKEKP